VIVAVHVLHVLNGDRDIKVVRARVYI